MTRTTRRGIQPVLLLVPLLLRGMPTAAQDGGLGDEPDPSCEVPPFPGHEGAGCPDPGGGVGVGLVMDSGFTVQNDDRFPPLADTPHMWYYATRSGPLDFTSGRKLYLNNYRNLCKVSAGLTPACSQQFLSDHWSKVGTCKYGGVDNLDGLRLCYVRTGVGGADLQFRVKYTATADPLRQPPAPLTSAAHYRLIVARNGWGRRVWDSLTDPAPSPPPLVQGTNLYATIPPAPDPSTWHFPVVPSNSPYVVQLTIEDAGCPPGLGYERPLTIGETENYLLYVGSLDSSVYLKRYGYSSTVIRLQSCSAGWD